MDADGTEVIIDGRRPVYLWSLPVFVFGALGASMATQIPSLLFFRFLQGLGVAPGLVLGPSVIGDIYKLEERGRAMSVFLSVSPVISRRFLYFEYLFLHIDMFTGTRVSSSSWWYVSSAVSYHHYFSFTEKVQGSIAFYFSWRTMQFYLVAAGIFQFCWMYSYFPETAQPGTRGIDKVPGIDSLKHHPKVIFINPLKPLALLRSPNLLLIVSYYFCMSPREALTLNYSKSLIASSSLMNFFCTFCIILFQFVEFMSTGNSASDPIALHYREHFFSSYPHPKCRPF
jgi:MFS family permease